MCQRACSSLTTCLSLEASLLPRRARWARKSSRANSLVMSIVTESVSLHTVKAHSVERGAGAHFHVNPTFRPRLASKCQTELGPTCFRAAHLSFRDAAPAVNRWQASQIDSSTMHSLLALVHAVQCPASSEPFNQPAGPTALSFALPTVSVRFHAICPNSPTVGRALQAQHQNCATRALVQSAKRRS
jgi:hypothetical protein